MSSTASTEEPPKIILSASTLGPTASGIPDHSRCGANCSLVRCYGTSIAKLPTLPDVQDFDCNNLSETIFQIKEGEIIQNYNMRWEHIREEPSSKKRVQESSLAIKEDLIDCILPITTNVIVPVATD